MTARGAVTRGGLAGGAGAVLAPQSGDGAADEFGAGRGGVPGGTVRDRDRDRRQPAQQRRRAQPVLLGGDVQRDGPWLGGERLEAVPGGPVRELRPVRGVRAAGPDGGGVLEQVRQPLDERCQVCGQVDGLEQRVGDRGLVRIVVGQRRQQPQPRGVAVAVRGGRRWQAGRGWDRWASHDCASAMGKAGPGDKSAALLRRRARCRPRRQPGRRSPSRLRKKTVRDGLGVGHVALLQALDEGGMHVPGAGRDTRRGVLGKSLEVVGKYGGSHLRDGIECFDEQLLVALCRPAGTSGR